MDKPHILVIEDDSRVCELLFSCLSKADCRVSVAQSGEAGLRQLEEERPEVVVLDLNLPDLSGLDICRSIRRDPWMSNLPVLMLTGQAEEEDILAGLEVGADDYMTKPFSPKLLVARVKALLRRGRNQKNTAHATENSALATGRPEVLMVKTLGKCELHFADRRLSWTEDFSPAQRHLMSILVGVPAGSIAQEAVQAEIWPDSTPARSRSSFDSLLSRVRRTLEEILDPFDSKKYLVVKRGFLNLENARIDAHEFHRLARQGSQQVVAREFWLAEIAFSSAFSLWQGRFQPGNFGSDIAVAYQDELEQLFLQASITFARLLAENKRYQPAASLLREALRYEPANDGVVRLLYQLSLAQDHQGQAQQILKQYSDALNRENFAEKEIHEILQGFLKGKPAPGWLTDN